MSSIPRGLCQCGCGQKVRIARLTKRSERLIKGQPKFFVSGHNRRGGTLPIGSRYLGGRYVLIKAPGHPRANSGRVYEHVLIAERALGHFMPEGAEVHHVNGDPHDNRPNNLVICESNTYHMLLHQRQRALRECGRADWRMCACCKQWCDPSELVCSRHRKCHTTAEAARRARNATDGRLAGLEARNGVANAVTDVEFPA